LTIAELRLPKKLEVLLRSLSSPLAAPFLSRMFVPEMVDIPTKGILDTPRTITPGETIEVLGKVPEAGVVRGSCFIVESPKIRCRLTYELPPEFRVGWDLSAEDMLFLGYTQPNPIAPYVTKAEEVTHPYLGTTVWVYAVWWTPLPYTAFYDGYIEVTVYNPKTEPATRIWWIHVERWRFREEFIKVIREWWEE